MLAIAIPLPYIADRLMYSRLKTFLSTLVFPVSATALYYLLSLEGPFEGDLLFFPYFIGDLPLKQLASVTGPSGLVFFVSWVSSVICWVWGNEFQWNTIKKGITLFSSIIILVLVFGGVKLSPMMYSDDVDSVRIAAITLNSPDYKFFSQHYEKIMNEKTSSPYDETMEGIEDLAKQAALGGAKIVSFQEYTIRLEEKNTAQFLDACKEFAKNNDIYLSITYVVFAEHGKGENRHAFINNQGEIEVNYMKRFLLGIGDIAGESVFLKKGPEIIPVVNTPYGNIGISICRDMDFSSYARQAGKKHVDIMLNPSDDHPRSYGHRTLMRAIENGFSFVRPTANGVSYASDYYGRILASKDYFATSNEIMYADVPIKGKKTIYPIIGDVFAWLCVLGFGTFVVFSIKDRVNKKNN